MTIEQGHFEGWRELTIVQQAFFAVYRDDHKLHNYKDGNIVIAWVPDAVNPLEEKLQVFWLGSDGNGCGGILWTDIDTYVRSKHAEVMATADPKQEWMLRPHKGDL